MDPRSHWEKVYGTKKPTEVSWYQSEAALSLSLIRRVVPERSAPIIDVGGGASTLLHVPEGAAHDPAARPARLNRVRL